MVVSTAAAGCSGAGSATASATDSDESADVDDSDALRAIPVTGFRNQDTSSGDETNDCWIYTATAWVESLEVAAHPKHLSVAYVDYWDWYAQITTGLTNSGDPMDPDSLDGGGEWGDAADIFLARGLVRVTDFRSANAPVETATSEANVVHAAAATMAKSLKSGALKTAAARADGAKVRAELDRAFALSTRVTTWMTEIFGADGATTLADGATAIAPLRSADDIAVRAPHPDGTVETVSLADAVGVNTHAKFPDGSLDPNVRSGPYAWSDAEFTLGSDAANGAYFARLTSALDAGAPLPFGWYWADNADPKGVGLFDHAPTGTTNTDDSTGHYALAVGYRASRDSVATVDFFRLKDSEPYVHNVAGTGFSEVYMTYLLASDRVYDRPTKTWSTIPTMMENVILPPGF